MKLNKTSGLIWILPIFMLLIAPFHLPYGYFIFLRIVITGCSGYLAYLEYTRRKGLSLFVVLFILLAILFNPLIPIYFSKTIWMSIDIFAALIFGIHAGIFYNIYKKL